MKVEQQYQAIEHESAINMLLHCRNPKVTNFISQGLTIKGSIEGTTPNRELTLEVMDGNNVICGANFTENKTHFHCQNISVNSTHQQRGIATSVYLLAQQIIGKTLENFWGNDDKQTFGAKRLWAQVDRPFGKEPPNHPLISSKPIRTR